jgi:hypothetical protein
MRTYFKLSLVLLTVCAVILSLNMITSSVADNHEVLKRIHKLKAHQALTQNLHLIAFESLENPRFSERQYRHTQDIDIEAPVMPA